MATTASAKAKTKTKATAKAKAKANAQAAGAAVRDYIAALPPAVRRRVQQMRAAIRAAAPGAVEHFSYRIPAFKLDGQPLVWYAGFREHTSLFPITEALLRAQEIHIPERDRSKGTLRFPLSKPLDVSLVKHLVKARAAEARKKPRA
jgi:uncharacterized protein YdhG (YjbR/CyaY superfamily)